MITMLLTGVAIATATVAQAQAPAATVAAQLTPGATVYDTSGGEAAKIESVTGDAVVVDTGTNKLAIPKTSFGAGANGPVLTTTKAQLDAAATQAAAEAKAALMAKLVPGAEIRGQAGETVIGSVKSVTGDLVLVTTPNGDVNVPSASFKVGPAGLLLQMSADAFNKAVADAKG
jgi:preprotein translocase subunit YajC